MNYSITRRGLLKSSATVSIGAIVGVNAGCSASRYSYLVADTGLNSNSPLFYWSDLMLQAVRDSSFSPLEASRVFALAHLAGSLAIGNQHSVLPKLVQARPQNIDDALAFGVAFSLACEEGLGRSLALSRRAFIRANDKQNKNASIEWGKTVAKAVIALRSRDGAQDSKSNFYPPQYPKRKDALAWSPTGPFYSAPNGPAIDSFQRGIRPGWGAQATWVAKSVNDYNAATFPEPGSLELQRQFEKVYEIGAGDSKSRTADQAEVALFWEDGPRGITVPGHFQLIAMQLINQRDYTFAEQSKILASLSLAQADSTIVAWHNKYLTDIIRPETAIRFAGSRFANTALAKLQNSSWRSFIPTPSFPSYVSGHSVIGAVSTEILTFMLGGDAIDLSGGAPDQVNWSQLKGVTRSWNSLRQIAEENGMSREYGGVHWEFDNTEGLRLGYQLAKEVYQADYRASDNAGESL